MKLVFLSDFLKEKDSIVLLLHEIGHIMLGHIVDDKALISDNVEYENEANEFAFLVQKQVKKQKVISYVSWTAFYTIISVSCITVLFMGFNTFKTNFDYHNTSSITENDVTSMSEADRILETSSVVVKITTTAMTTTTTTTESATTTEEEDTATYSNEIYYITNTGNKYHRENCYHIARRSVVGMNLEDLERMGYQPCLDCIGDK